MPLYNTPIPAYKAVVALLLCIGPAGAQPSQQAETYWRRAIANASTSSEAAKAYEHFFKIVGPERASSLTADPDNTIALFSAWNRCRGAKTEPVAHVSRFFGFVEGKTGCKLPARWEAAALSALWHDQPTVFSEATERLMGNVSFVEKIGGTGKTASFVIHPQKLSKVDGDLLVAEGTSVSTVNRDTVSLKVRGDAIAVDKALIKSLRKGMTFDLGYFAFNEDKAFISFMSDLGAAFPLVCVDRKSGNIEWKSNVWATAGERRLRLTGGLVAPYLKMEFTAGRAILFGVAGDNCFVEAFDIKSGKAVFRFSTNYWSWDRSRDRETNR